jgi:hypothetical protein
VIDFFTALALSLPTGTSRLLDPVTCPSSRDFVRSPISPSWRQAAPKQPATFTIPSFPQSNRRPANIPLHNLASSSRPRDHDSAYLLDDHDKDSARSSFDTPSTDSDLSLWSDTGDLVDQLADREDPLRIRLRESADGGNPSKPRRQQKRTRFASQDYHPGPRTISKAEQIIAAIMAPNDGPSRIHGLHGKKLMWVGTIPDGRTSH